MHKNNHKYNKRHYEVLIDDIFTGHPVVAEYKGESKRVGNDSFLYKVYHPIFEEVGFRWVYSLGKNLGPLD